MKIDVNSLEMLCNKISENPRKGFLQLLALEMNKIKKRIYFRTLRHSSFLLPPVMECFMEKGAFWDTLLYILHTLQIIISSAIRPINMNGGHSNIVYTLLKCILKCIFSKVCTLLLCTPVTILIGISKTHVY